MRAVPRPRSGPARRGPRASAWTGGVLLLLVTAAGCGTLPAAEQVAPAFTPAASAEGVRTVRFDHRSGAARRPATVVAVPRGAVVALVVGSDVTERVTLTGLGWSRYVTAGSTVSLRFVAERPGEMTVIAGDPAVELGRLQVR